MNTNVSPMTEALRELDSIMAVSTEALDVRVGAVEVDLFEHESTVGHRTYRYGAHHFTGVESFDSYQFCDRGCLLDWVERGGVPISAVELTTSVERNFEVVDCSTYLWASDGSDPGAVDLDPGQAFGEALCFPLDPSSFADSHASCHSCGRLLTLDGDTRDYVEQAFGQYVETALWSSLNWSDEVGDGNPNNFDTDGFTADDLDPGTAVELLGDVVDFVANNWSHVYDLDPGRVGHDFWLTRNGHGAGFWDGDYEENLGRFLTEQSKPYGEVNLYVGDDGDIYC